MDSLRQGNEVRFKRADLKRDLKSRQADVTDLLEAPPMWLRTMRVRALLLVVPKLGAVKVDRALAQCRIAPSKTIGGLSKRQRAEIVRYLRRGTA
jgi:hypothetical protein